MKPKPTPKQARLLRHFIEHPELVVRLWFSQADWMPLDVKPDYSARLGPDEKFKAQVFSTCRRLGWLESVDQPTYARLSLGEAEVYLRLSDEGRAAHNRMALSHFVSPVRPSVRGRTGHILRALAVRHSSPEWVFLPEAPIWTPTRGTIHVDALALDCWRTKGFVCVGYEIKVSRGDFLGELRRPHKTAASATFCHEFYFAAPAGLIAKSEVPDPYGLVVVSDKGATRMVKRCKPARPEPTWGMMAMLLQRILDENGEIANVE